ncbi:MAG: ABC transporter substrate-binding protein [Halanaerobiales bacterium]
MKKDFIIYLTLAFLLIVLINSGPALAQQKIVFGDLTWQSSEVHNRIAGFIIENGYGHEVDYMYGQTEPIITGLRGDDVDVVMEAWTHNWEDPYFEAIKEGEVIDLGSNYPPSPQGWYVPTYVIEGDEERDIEPMAPDLESVNDLNDYWELFKHDSNDDKGRFYNGPVDWKVYDQNVEKLAGYGLDNNYESYNPGSQTALDTTVMDHYREGEPILFYYWEPTWLMGWGDFTKLEEPDYSEKVWEDNKACAFPDVKVNIAVDASMPERFPRVTTFLANYETGMELNNEILNYIEDQEDMSPEEAAIWFLKEHEEVWHDWFRDVDEGIIEKVEDALEER